MRDCATEAHNVDGVVSHYGKDCHSRPYNSAIFRPLDLACSVLLLIVLHYKSTREG